MSRWKPDARGRLAKAALELYDEQGFDQTTVVEIAGRAGLTKRTFFRHFADKREVLFAGSDELQTLFVEAVRAAPAEAGPLDAVTAGLDRAGALLQERRPFAIRRQKVIGANPELQERELIKLAGLAAAVAAALRARGVPDRMASLTAEAGITVFRVAFESWVDGTGEVNLQRLLREALEDLRAVTAG